MFVTVQSILTCTQCKLYFVRLLRYIIGSSSIFILWNNTMESQKTIPPLVSGATVGHIPALLCQTAAVSISLYVLCLLPRRSTKKLKQVENLCCAAKQGLLLIAVELPDYFCILVTQCMWRVNNYLCVHAHTQTRPCQATNRMWFVDLTVISTTDSLPVLLRHTCLGI